MNVSQGMSETTKFPLLERLPFEFSAKDLASWLDIVNTLGFGYNRILKLPSDMFWSTAIFNESLMNSFDSALDTIPKGHEVKLFELIYNWDDEARKSVERLRTAILAVYCRIAVYNKTLDSGLTSKQWVEFTASRGVMPMGRATAVWAHFPQMTEVFSKIVVFSSKFLLNPARDIASVATSHKKSCADLESSVSALLDFFSLSKGVRRLRSANCVVNLLYLVVDTIYFTLVVLEVLAGAKMTGSVSEFISGIPSLVEAVTRAFPVEVLIDIAATLPGYPLRHILGIVSHLEQGAGKVFHRALEVQSSPLERFTTVQGALTNERFIFFANEYSPLSASLSSGCEPEQRRYIENAVEGICLTQIAESKKRLERQGLLERIGELNGLTVEQRSALDGLKDMLPHLSNEYAHLCLRHFNYDIAVATEALLCRDERLPMELRRVENTDLRPSDTTANLPMLSFEEEDLLLSTVKLPSDASFVCREPPKPTEEDKKNVFKGLFSLAPATQKPQESTATSQGPEPKATVSEVMKKLRAALDSVKLRAEGKDPDFEIQEGPNGEKLVPMKEAKRYAGIQKFKTSEADKVAIRPSYEKFRYETMFDEEDLYDDEYDDGYEQKEFRIEPLNGRLSEDEEDDPDAGNSSDAQPAPSINSRGQAAPSQSFNRGGGRGNRGSGGRGGRGGKGGPPPQQQANSGSSGGGEHSRGGGQSTRGTEYTGGRQRQMKERHKNDYKQRGADRKMRAAFQ